MDGIWGAEPCTHLFLRGDDMFPSKERIVRLIRAPLMTNVLWTSNRYILQAGKRARCTYAHSKHELQATSCECISTTEVVCSTLRIPVTCEVTALWNENITRACAHASFGGGKIGSRRKGVSIRRLC